MGTTEVQRSRARSRKEVGRRKKESRWRAVWHRCGVGAMLSDPGQASYGSKELHAVVQRSPSRLAKWQDLPLARTPAGGAPDRHQAGHSA